MTMFSLMGNCFTWVKRRREPIKKITLLMVGLDNAGKTSTVADLKGDTVDGITPTVGFLSSSFSLYRFNVTMFDLGGGSQIRAIWKNYYSEVYGMVFVVDASDRHRLDECRDVLHETVNNTKISGKPLLILANKQDIIGAMDEDEIHQCLDLGSIISRNKCPCQVFSCTALLGQGNKIDRQIKKGFQWLLSEVSNNFAPLSQRVERDSAEQRRIMAEERKQKFERVRKEREARERAEKEAAEKSIKQNEESDEDVVVGQNSRNRSPSPEPGTPVKKKKKSKRKPIEKSPETTPPLNHDTSVEDSSTLPRRLKPLGDLEDKVHSLARGALEPLDASQQSLNEDTEASKKKKRKKKKQRSNKTAPIDEDTERTEQGHSALAWGTPPSTLNGFPGSSSGTSSRRLQPLSHNGTLFSDSRVGGSTIPEDDQEHEPGTLAPIRNKSWTRTRPNSEDIDVMT